MAGKIVVATDGSETGNRALDCAAELSGKLGRDLCIVHVLMHGRPSKEFSRMAEAEGLIEHVSSAETYQSRSLPASLGAFLETAEDEVAMARAIAAVGDEVIAAAKRRTQEAGAKQVTTHVRSGDYADEILEVAESEDADMIVIGRRGLGRVREAVLGSVSQKVLHHAPCTVVIVH